MFFGQKIHPFSFEYGATAKVRGDAVEVGGKSFRARVRCAEITEFCTRLTIENSNVADARNYSDGVVETLRTGTPVAPKRGTPAVFAAKSAMVEVGASTLRITLGNRTILESAPEGFGFSGEKAILNFHLPDASGYYGFGERTKRFNKSGDNLEFWNVDVAGVFVHTSTRDDYDPAYVAIPLAIINIGGAFCGIFVDNPDRMLMNAGEMIAGHFIVETLAGNNDVYFINGPTLREVTRNFAALTGRAEMPPLWSMGYHQCRWGYQTDGEFRALAENFRKHDLPVSAFWYDIDYMRDYRVFTWDETDIPKPRKLNEELKRAGIATVTIVDPGVKLEPGYEVYDSGKKADVFCQTAAGRDFVGQVWPGDTVFPDFTRDDVQDWWAGHLAKFMKDSMVDGAWLDMNDPSTGSCDADDMLFQKGKVAHGKYHNQYGHYMARASRLAFEKLDPQQRPFLLTRSGYTGTQRYSAIWNGDNDSNWRHLRMSIPCTINLGLSGVAFNGPDVGGFMGNTTSELLIRWYQAGFLFPFFRNHTIANSKTQEPWEFGPQILGHVRDVLHTRYRLLPYLYACFFQHYLTGDPILRPLLYEFAADIELENLDDQFMIGDSLMCAPIVRAAENSDSIVVRGERRQLRHITFPAGFWYDLNIGEWIEGGKTIHYAVGFGETPIFARDGGILPYFNGTLRNSEMPLDELELHVFAKDGTGRLTLHIDDRTTRRYLEGHFNTAEITAKVNDAEARIDIHETGKLKAGSVRFTPVIYGRQGIAKAVVSINGGAAKAVQLKPFTRRWVGKDIPVRARDAGVVTKARAAAHQASTASPMKTP